MKIRGFWVKPNCGAETGVRRYFRVPFWCGVLSMVFLTGMGRADITFDAASRILCVEDYPERIPCRLGNLLQTDRMNGWGIVNRDPGTHRYTLDAHLQIGRNRERHTYFQIGGSDALDECLVVNGNVLVYPEFVKGQNVSKGRDWINALTVGVRGEPRGTATLAIMNSDETLHTLYISRMPGENGTWLHPPYTAFGGTLAVYNGVIRGVGRDGNRRMPEPVLYAQRVILDHARIEYFEGCFTSGCFAGATRITGTTFAYGGSVVRNPGLNLDTCTLHDLDIAVGDVGGPIRANLTRCRLYGNRRNVRARFCGGGVVFTDCVVEPAILPDFVGNVQRGAIKEPPASVIVQRHVPIVVTNPDGTPLPGARIKITPENADGDIHARAGWSGVTSSGDDITPAGQVLALLICTRDVCRDAADQPERQTYRYRMTVAADGYPDLMLSHIRPDAVAEPLRFTMKHHE